MTAYIAVFGGIIAAHTGHWNLIPALMIVEIVQFQAHIRSHPDHKGLHPTTTRVGELITLTAATLLAILSYVPIASAVPIDLRMHIALIMLLVGQMSFSSQAHQIAHGDSVFVRTRTAEQFSHECLRVTLILLGSFVSVGLTFA
jgi:hypothetical protein